MCRSVASAKTMHLKDLRTEGFEPGKKPMECGLIRKWTVQDRLYLLERVEALEVKQGLGREHTRYPNLVIERCHHSPQQSPNRSVPVTDR